MAGSLAVIAEGLWKTLRHHRPSFDSWGGWWISAFLLQYLLVLPHELGHALAARRLGYDEIRIIIGSGKPIYSARFLGFPWLFRLVPVGGITYLGMPKGPKDSWRWKHFVTVAAGPAVNLLLAAAAWRSLGPGLLFSGVWTWAKVLLLANLIVLAGSLFPYIAWTPFGRVPTDGLQIWNILFRWNKPFRERSARVPFWAGDFGLPIPQVDNCIAHLFSDAAVYWVGMVALVRPARYAHCQDETPILHP